MIKGQPEFSPWLDDPDPPEYWSEQDYSDMRRSLRAHWDGVDFTDYDPNQARNEQGEWTSGGGSSGDSEEEAKKFATEKLIDDGSREGTSRVRVVKDEYIGWWGSSHSLSKAITAHSSKLMNIDGYEDEIGMDDPGKRLGEKFLDTIAADKRGAGEPLYHGFDNFEKIGGGRFIEFKQGDTMKLPLMASTGDLDNAASYGVDRRARRPTARAQRCLSFRRIHR